jgi:Zn-dependent protease
MLPGSAWPVPFFLDPHNLRVDAVATFCVSILFAITINAEAQAFMSNFLGDRRTEPKDRLHFNAFLHLDILGTICYLVGGFGWARNFDIDRSKFKHPRAYMILTRVTGPVANLLLASIVGSIVMIFNKLSYDPRVFLMLLGVNVTTAVYNLIPIPPLAMGHLVLELIPQADERFRKLALQAGPFLVLALVFLERASNHGIFNPYFGKAIKAIYHYLATG